MIIKINKNKIVGAKPKLEEMDCHVVSGALKKFFRDLPSPLFTFDHHDSFTTTAGPFFYLIHLI